MYLLRYACVLKGSLSGPGQRCENAFCQIIHEYYQIYIFLWNLRLTSSLHADIYRHFKFAYCTYLCRGWRKKHSHMYIYVDILTRAYSHVNTVELIIQSLSIVI